MIEHYCKKNTNGRIPGKESIPEILRKAKQDFDATCGNVISHVKKKRNKGNPSRNVLVEHGYCFQMLHLTQIQATMHRRVSYQ
jgi:hypothetical protein